MTTQVPYGPENADYPQFSMGYAQYPPAPPNEYPAPQHQQHSQQHPQHEMQREAPLYPQQGAAAAPQPTPYPQPTAYQEPAAYQQPAAYAQPAADPQPSAYPTAPPWAAAPAPAVGQPGPAPAPTPPHGAYLHPATPHGGLLVPFPEEMKNVSSAQAPKVWPVAAFTLLPFPLGAISGAISAARRTDHARRTRNSAAPYWIAYGITLVSAGFIWFVVTLVGFLPAYSSVQEDARLKVVQENVLQDGQLKSANITATAAKCRADGDRRADGMRDYRCQLTLQEGGTATLALTADTDGTWTSRPL